MVDFFQRREPAQRKKAVDSKRRPEDRKLIGQEETETDLQEETASIHPLNAAQLSQELTDKERAQAIEALAFLKEIRQKPQTSTVLPEQIGRYSIIRSIGRGGFAEVFLAEDKELDRKVALKVPLFDSLRNQLGGLRFEREAKLVASLVHPQIVPVFEYGEVASIRFIAFGWVDGPNLSSWIKTNGRVNFRTAALIVKHLCEAVHHAHQRGIVHRDLKPGNVLVDEGEQVTKDPVWKRLRITDFGLARNLEVSDVTLTQDGQLVGTPAYMSPEQAKGEIEVRAACDVHALGVILYELITGTVPFTGETNLSVIRAVETEVPKPPRRLDNSIPKDLDAICQKCLCKSPSDRYATAFELAEELTAFLGNRPVKARPPNPLQRVSRWAANNRKLALAVSFAFASLVIGLGISIWQRNVALAESVRANRESQRAVVEAERASSNLASMYRAIDLMLDESKGAQQTVSAAQRRLLIEIVNLQQNTSADRDAVDYWPTRLESLSRAIRIHRYLGKYEQCEELYSECSPLFEELNFAKLTPDDLKVCWSATEQIFSSCIFAERRLNKPERTLQVIEEFSQVIVRSKTVHDPLDLVRLNLFVLDQKCNVFVRMNELDTAMDYSRKACVLAEPYLSRMTKPGFVNRLAYQLATVYANKARVFSMAGQKDQAAASTKTAIELLHSYRPDNQNIESKTKSLALQKMIAAQYATSPGSAEKSLLDEAVKEFESIVEKYPSDIYSKEVLTAAYVASVTLMEKMKKSSPGHAISTTEALINLDKIDKLAEQGLLNTFDGRSRFLSAVKKKVELLLELDQYDLAYAAAARAVDTVESFKHAESSSERVRDTALGAWLDLAKCQLAKNDLGDFLATVKKIKRFIKAENQVAVSKPSSMTERRGHRLAWALRHESRALAELGQYDEAIDLVRQHYLLIFPSGKYEGHARYRSSAECMGIVLGLWAESGGTTEESFVQAKTDAIQWLDIGMQNGIYLTEKMCRKKAFDPFRSDERFISILTRLSERN